MHTAMHHSCCHLPADPCKGGVFPHLREGSLTAQVLHQYTVEGRETSSHLEVNVCRKKYLQVNQHTARVGEQFDKHLHFEQKVSEKNLKYAQFYRNTVFALAFRYRIRYRTIEFPIFRIGYQN